MQERALGHSTAKTSNGVEYRIRPIRPDDAERERAFISALSPESRHARFMHAMNEPSPDFVKQLVEVDGLRNQALVAVIGSGSDERIIAVARYAADDDGKACEFAVAVADDWQCRGVGTTLIPLLFEHAARAGFETIYGTVLADNARMIDLARWLGLTVEPARAGEATVRAWRRLR